jgi:hypothetical protein
MFLEREQIAQIEQMEQSLICSICSIADHSIGAIPCIARSSMICPTW